MSLIIFFLTSLNIFASGSPIENYLIENCEFTYKNPRVIDKILVSELEGKCTKPFPKIKGGIFVACEARDESALPPPKVCWNDKNIKLSQGKIRKMINRKKRESGDIEK